MGKLEAPRLERYKKGLKIALIGLGIFILVVFTGNTNQNPELFIDRIFRPIGGSDWSINYGGITILVGTYYLLKAFYKLTNLRMLNERWKRILCVLVTINLLSSFQVELFKSYLSMQDGVDAIYLDREHMKIDYEVGVGTGEVILTLQGDVLLENTANTPRTFQMQVTTPWRVTEITEGEWIEVNPLDGEFYTLQGKEKSNVAFEAVIKADKEDVEQRLGEPLFNSWSMTTTIFEVFLYDGLEEAYFEVERPLKGITPVTEPKRK